MCPERRLRKKYFIRCGTDDSLQSLGSEPSQVPFSSVKSGKCLRTGFFRRVRFTVFWISCCSNCSVIISVRSCNAKMLLPPAISSSMNWSNSFSAAANRSLGWSEGAHGLRHSYAQERMHELQKSGLSRDRALETVSQEMGHFRPSITEIYLR